MTCPLFKTCYSFVPPLTYHPCSFTPSLIECPTCSGTSGQSDKPDQRLTQGLLQSQVQEQFNVVSTRSNAQRGHQMAACSQQRAGAHIDTEAGAEAATHGMLCIQTAARVKPALGRLNTPRVGWSGGRPQHKTRPGHVQVLPITMATAAANRRSKHNQRMVAMGALTTLTTDRRQTNEKQACC